VRDTAPVAPTAQAPDGPKGPKWTVMVFMDAQSATGFAPLLRMAQRDIAEMREVPVSSLLDIFVELHTDRGATRFRFGQKATREYQDGREMPARSKSVTKGRLSTFIEWALDRSKANPGDHSMLVIWGHSYQHAVGQEPQRDGSVNALDFDELAGALRKVQARRRAGKLVDIVGFDACDLATVEVALQLEPVADFLLASEMGIPLPGWPYDRILGRIQDPQGRPMGPAELGSFAVRRFCETYAAKRPASLTLLRLSRAEQVARSVGVLADSLAVAVTRSPRDKQLIVDLFSRAQTDQGKPFVDLADLCLNLIREVDDPRVVKAANTVGDLVLAPDGVTPGNSREGIGQPFVHELGRNAVRTAKLNGVSLYAPHVAGPHDVAGARTGYERFKFAMPGGAQRSTWNQLVHNLAGVP
jgi:hypothetical protein